MLLFSLFFEIGFELHRKVVIGPESSISSLLFQSRVPICELIEAVAVAESFLHSKEHQVVLSCTFGEAGFGQGLGDHGVFSHLVSIEVFLAQVGRF